MSATKEKSGGRKVGTPNKRSLFLQELLELKSISIPEKLLEVLPRLSFEKQADVYLKLMEFVYPKRKAVILDNFHENGQQDIVDKRNGILRIMSDPKALACAEYILEFSSGDSIQKI